MGEDLAQVGRHWYADIPGAFMGVGAGQDPDSAFDDAVEAAWYDYGHAGLVPSVADIPAGSAELSGAAPTSLLLAVRQARRALADLPAGKLVAVALLADKAFRRRKVRARIDDPALEWPAGSGEVVELTAPAEQAVLGAVRAQLAQKAALATGDQPTKVAQPISDDEQLESVYLVRASTSYKALAQANKGQGERSFVVQLGAAPVLGGFRTAGEARRAAVAGIRAGDLRLPAGTSQTYQLAVYAMSGRAGGLPLVSVARTRVRQRASIVVTLATPKPLTKAPKVAGWLFYGRQPDQVGS